MDKAAVLIRDERSRKPFLDGDPAEAEARFETSIRKQGEQRDLGTQEGGVARIPQSVTRLSPPPVRQAFEAARDSGRRNWRLRTLPRTKYLDAELAEKSLSPSVFQVLRRALRISYYGCATFRARK